MILDQPVCDLVTPPGPIGRRIKLSQSTGGAQAAVLPLLGFQHGPQPRSHVAVVGRFGQAPDNDQGLVRPDLEQLLLQIRHLLRIG